MKEYKLYIHTFHKNYTDKWEGAGIMFLSTGTKEMVHEGGQACHCLQVPDPAPKHRFYRLKMSIRLGDGVGGGGGGYRIDTRVVSLTCVPLGPGEKGSRSSPESSPMESPPSSSSLGTIVGTLPPSADRRTRWHRPRVVESRVTKSCQLADSTSVRARPPGGSQPCASLYPVDISDFQLCNEQRLPFSRV